MTQTSPHKSLVLYADDDPDDLSLVKDAFNRYANHIELITFKDGCELLDFIHHSSFNAILPCLIILDINMPKKTGKQILVELRQLPRFENVPVILFTTSTLPSEKQFAQAYNATCITKPLYTTQIREAVDKMIDHCPEEVKKTIKGL